MKIGSFLILLVLLIINVATGFNVTLDSTLQRTDGSKYIDIWYSLDRIDDCVKIKVTPVTKSGEILTCETFLASSDTGVICREGLCHIIWDAGADVPDREFYKNKVVFEIIAAKPGIVPGDCGCGLCVDIDGNRYKTVQIGDQCWMAENLKVTHYRDGTPIPHVTDPDVWDTLSTDAYCEYDNDPSNVPTYGRLYNWYAVDDPRDLAPVGWHVPTDEEYKTLEMYLGMDSAEANARGWRGTDQGSQLADSAGLWYDGVLENNPAFGASGFAALPGGYRSHSGAFYGMTNYAHFWSSAEASAASAWHRDLSCGSADVHRSIYGKGDGFSVLCVRD